MDKAGFYGVAVVAIIAAIGIGGSISYAVISAGRRKEREMFAIISEKTGGVIENSLMGGLSLVGVWREIPYRIRIMPGNQYSAPDLRIEFAGMLPYVLTLQEEGLNSRLEELVGFGRGKNIKTGIVEFD